MHPKRVLEVINNTRVSKNKRRFWPRYSAVFVSIDGEILDVVQYYDTSTEEMSRDHGLYPGSAYFIAVAGTMYETEEQVLEKVRSCQAALKRKRPKGHSGALLNIDGEWVPSGGSKADEKKRNHKSD